MSSARTDQPPPRVSVLMTIYNAAPFLRRSIDSIVNQSFADWELIAVENGSSDESAAILAGYTDARVRPFLLESNIGRTPALRHAFERARGEYIAVLDADDVACPERFRKQIAYLDTHRDVALLGTWADYIDVQDAVVGEWTPSTDTHALRISLGSENPIVHSSAMYRAALAREVGGYPLDTPYAQDYALWLKLAKRGVIAVLGERLSRFRIVAHSMTRARPYRVDVARDTLQLLRRAGEQLALGKEGRRKNREEIAIARMRYAAALARSGHVVAGTCAVCVALVIDPVSLINNRITRRFFSR